MHEHEHESIIDGIIEVTFGLEHMVSEFFWNAVFAIGIYFFSKARALRKIHKYVDDKHDLKHDKY
jgi:hypothetical protein